MKGKVQTYEKNITDEKTGISYTFRGDYYLPDLVLAAEKEKPIGIWGQRHLHYLKEHKRLVYLNLLTSGRLNEYLASVDEQAEEMFFRLVKEYADRQGVLHNPKQKQLGELKKPMFSCIMKKIKVRDSLSEERYEIYKGNF